jgi:hypothetical protein
MPQSINDIGKAYQFYDDNFSAVTKPLSLNHIVSVINVKSDFKLVVKN